MNAARAGRNRERGGQRRAGPVPIREAMRALLDDLGMAPKVAAYDLMAVWPEVVGAQIARVATPERVENGILYVSVASAPWRAELAMKRGELLEKLNRRAGKPVLSDIRFR